MAEILSEQYSSVFSEPREPLLDPNHLFDSEDPSNLIDITFSPADIIEAIDKLSANSAPGTDCFPAVLLKQCKELLAVPLYEIWRGSLDLSITPEDMIQSLIVPMHKGDSTALAKNYRPVALTSHLVKIFEKVIRKHIVNHLETTNAFNPSQHGFRSGRSCLSQLLAHYDRILSELERGYNVDVIYLDFAKAFDKLDFNVTLSKLKMLGIDGKIGKWIHSFLTGRHQSVVVNGVKSVPAPVLSGVPQGSVIGPILFLILIADIDHNVANSFLSSFADDTRVGKGIQSERDAELLQQDLNHIYDWSSRNNMQFNHSKFELLRYGINNDLKNATSYSSNENTPIEAKPMTKDLGVIMSNTGDFKDHISHLTEAVRDLSAWILRSFKSRSRVLMLTLWKSIVIPRLDYCSQLWNPSQAGVIRQLEDLQKYFVKRIHGFRHMDYWDALKELGLYSLQRRRERYQTIYLWSMIEAKVPNIASASGTPLVRTQSEITSRRGRTIRTPTIKRSRYSTLRYYSLPFHGARLFNKLPAFLRNLTNISKDTFKYHLDLFLKTVPDEPLMLGYTQFRQAQSNSLVDMITSPAGREESALDRGR